MGGPISRIHCQTPPPRAEKLQEGPTIILASCMALAVPAIVYFSKTKSRVLVRSLSIQGGKRIKLGELSCVFLSPSFLDTLGERISPKIDAPRRKIERENEYSIG
jgi:hypothetical protein